MEYCVPRGNSNYTLWDIIVVHSGPWEDSGGLDIMEPLPLLLREGVFTPTEPSGMGGGALIKLATINRLDNHTPLFIAPFQGLYMKPEYRRRC